MDKNENIIKMWKLENKTKFFVWLWYCLKRIFYIFCLLFVGTRTLAKYQNNSGKNASKERRERILIWILSSLNKNLVIFFLSFEAFSSIQPAVKYSVIETNM